MHTGKQCLTMRAVKKMAKCTRTIGMRSSFHQQIRDLAGAMAAGTTITTAGIAVDLVAVSVGLGFHDVVETAATLGVGAVEHFLKLAQPARVSFNVRLRARPIVVP